MIQFLKKTLAFGLLFSSTTLLASNIDFIPLKEKEMTQEISIPKYLYKVVSFETWQTCRETQELKLSTMDNEFIHLATEEQLPYVINKFWAGKHYFILKVEREKLIGKLVYESNRSKSDKFFHLYEGSIPLYSITEVSKEI